MSIGQNMLFPMFSGPRHYAYTYYTYYTYGIPAITHTYYTILTILTILTRLTIRLRSGPLKSLNMPLKHPGPS